MLIVNYNYYFPFLPCCRLSLTSSQPQTRARGVQLLSEVLQECYGGLGEREGELFIFYRKSVPFT